MGSLQVAGKTLEEVRQLLTERIARAISRPQLDVRRGGKTYELDLQALYEQGEVSQNWLLRDGDVLNVPDRTRNKVFVIVPR